MAENNEMRPIDRRRASFEVTSETARATVGAEKQAREEKTARLKAMRVAQQKDDELP